MLLEDIFRECDRTFEMWDEEVERILLIVGRLTRRWSGGAGETDCDGAYEDVLA